MTFGAWVVCKNIVGGETVYTLFCGENRIGQFTSFEEAANAVTR